MEIIIWKNVQIPPSDLIFWTYRVKKTWRRPFGLRHFFLLGMEYKDMDIPTNGPLADISMN